MATVQIADIYNPLTFGGLIQERQIELNKFLSSGVAAMSGLIANQISAGGNIGELTNYNPLATPEPNYSTDNPAVFSTPLNVDSAKQTFRLASQNQSWSTMDIANELALQNPEQAIINRIANYWATNNEKRLIQASLGVLADNIANDSGDMLVDVATDSASAITDAERISAEVVIDCQQTLGDHMDNLRAIAMPSTIFSRLKKQNLISFIPNARGEVNIPTYLDLTVIVDDSLPQVAGSNRITYTCILFGASVFGMASGRVNVPSELIRVPSSGNGGGEEILHSRRNDVIHPFGFDFLSGSVAGQSATQAELALAANWNRIWLRKNIPLAFIEVND